MNYLLEAALDEELAILLELLELGEQAGHLRVVELLLSLVRRLQRVVVILLVRRVGLVVRLGCLCGKLEENNEGEREREQRGRERTTREREGERRSDAAFFRRVLAAPCYLSEILGFDRGIVLRLEVRCLRLVCVFARLVVVLLRLSGKNS